MNKLDRLRTSQCGMAIWTVCSIIMINCMIEREKFLKINTIQRVTLAILTVVFALLLHEIIHAVFAFFFTKKPVRITVERVKGFGYVPMTRFYDDNLKLWERIVIAITPFLLLTVGLSLASPFITNDKLAFVAYIIVLGNCAGCYKDILDCVYYIGINGKK